MTRSPRRLLLCFACLLLLPSVRTLAASSPIRFAGQNAELVLSEVSERTLRVELFPFDEHGHLRPPTSRFLRDHPPRLQLDRNGLREAVLGPGAEGRDADRPADDEGAGG